MSSQLQTNKENSPTQSFTIRHAKLEDCGAILQHIKDLVVHQNIEETVVEITEKDLIENGFGESPSFKCLVAEEEREGKDVIVGHVVYAEIYSTWNGRSLYIEDVYVRPESREKGIGYEFFKCLSKTALDNGLSKIRWYVLNGNEVAVNFYKRMEAIIEEDWHYCTLTPDKMKKIVKPEDFIDMNKENSPTQSFTIRQAKPEDCGTILQHIKALAVHEREEETVVEVTEKDLVQDGFGESPCYKCLVAEEESEGKGIVVGYAIYYEIYSTWKGRSLFIEDIYVRPESRGKGVGYEFFKCLSKVALDNGFSKIIWLVLNFNEIAVNFYKRIEARTEEELDLCTLTSDKMKKLVKPEGH